MSHSSYWLENIEATEQSLGIDRLTRLSSVRRAIGNFVHILTRDNTIAVRFSSGQKSYTDGKTVTVSATDDPKKFDQMVGLALHEGAHCLLSDFPFLNVVMEDYRFYGALHPELREFIYPSTIKGTQVIKDVKECILDLMNIIEDRRIDTYIYRKAPGYRPYYDAMYNELFYNEKLEVAFRTDPALRVPTVQNYRDWLLMSFADFFDPGALPGLREMVGVMDLDYIRRFDEPRMVDVQFWTHERGMIPDPFINGFMKPYDYNQFPELWKVANQLLLMILQYTQKHNPSLESTMSFGKGKDSHSVKKFPDPNPSSEPGALPNLDTGTSTDVSELIEAVRKAVAGNPDKKTLSTGQLRQLETFENSGTEQVTVQDSVYGKVQCLVVKKVTKDIVQSKWFPFREDRVGEPCPLSTLAIDEGIRMGSMLVNKLQVRNETQETTYTRKSLGHIDRRLLAQLGTDNMSIFKRKVVDIFNPALLYFTLDASESMYGPKWTKTMALAIATAYAATRIQSLDVVITIRGCTRDAKPLVVVCFDSRKDQFSKIRSVFPYLSPNGSTPEGLCFAATHDLIAECTKTHITYMVNVSDGQPGCIIEREDGVNITYAGMNAVRQTEGAVKKLLRSGVNILSYFVSDALEDTIGSSRDVFRQMYGSNASFIEPTQVTEVAKTLNKLLLTKDSIE